MPITTERFVRRIFYVDAVSVTEDNIADIAEWCKGTVKADGAHSYIKVRVDRPVNGRQTKAFIGDWVVFAGRGFKVYTQKAFANSFDKFVFEPVIKTEKLTDAFHQSDKTLPVYDTEVPEIR